MLPDHHHAKEAKQRKARSSHMHLTIHDVKELDRDHIYTN